MVMAPDKIKLEKNYIKQSKNNNKKGKFKYWLIGKLCISRWLVYYL
jgi:hypothetical protein